MRINWRNDVTKNEAVRLINCNSCGSDAGKVCYTKSGEVAANIHAPRFDAACVASNMTKSGP